MGDELAKNGEQVSEIRIHKVILGGELATNESGVGQETLTFGEQARRGHLIGIVGRKVSLVRRAHRSDLQRK